MSENYNENEEIELNDGQSPNQGNSFNPFPGLRPFKIDESHLFFGREGQSDEVLLKLSQNRFIGVIGPSGSGKSSFVYCGVLPILYGGFLTEVSSEWEVIVSRPGAGPIDNLADSICRSDDGFKKSTDEERKVKRTIVSTLMKSSSLGLVEAIKQQKKNTDKNFLILVDQFEELFRFKDSREDGAIDETLAFINLLLEAVDNAEVPIYVALTMRSDFIGECAQFSDLTKKINDSHYLIPQLTREQKRKAIEGPIAVGGADISPLLVQRLLNDLGDNPDQLPILQHSLMRTWDYWTKYKNRDEDLIDIKHYEAIGTMSEALSLHANEAFDELSEKQKLICESLFKAITESRGGDNNGIRRPSRLGDIAAISGASPQEVAEVIEKFRAPGRSLLMPAVGNELTVKSVIDISHESLMRIWVRLKNWVEDEAEAVQMYLRLAEAASMYQLGKAGLWRPPDLQLALNWEEKHKPSLIWAQRYHPAFERTMEFLSHSKKEYETEQKIKELQAKRRLKTARVTAMVMAGLCVVAIGFLMYAFDQNAYAFEQFSRANAEKDSAQRARELADSNAAVALENEKIAKLNEQIADSAKTEAELNAEMARLQKIAADSNAEQARINMLEAVKNEQEADRQRGFANQNADSAKRAMIFANQQSQIATRRFYVAKSIEVANRSIQMDFGTFQDIKGLLAQQAYIFNNDYEGYGLQSEIYNALYFALANYEDVAYKNNSAFSRRGNVFLQTVHSKKAIYSVQENGSIKAWSQANNYRGTILSAGITNLTVKAIAVSPDERYLTIVGVSNDKGAGYIIDLNNTTDRTEIQGLGKSVIDISYAGKDIYMLDDAGTKLIKYNNGKITLIKESSQNDKFTSLATNQNSNICILGTSAGKVLTAPLNSNKFEPIMNGRSYVTDVGISPDGKILAYGDASGILSINYNGAWNQIPTHQANVVGITFSKDGKFMATASTDATARLWNLLDLTKEAIKLDDHNGFLAGLAFTPESNRLMTATRAREATFWPVSLSDLNDRICKYVSRNLTIDEWERYVGALNEIKWQPTCANLGTKPNTSSEDEDE